MVVNSLKNHWGKIKKIKDDRKLGSKVKKKKEDEKEKFKKNKVLLSHSKE